jgi:hypothetical protein
MFKFSFRILAIRSEADPEMTDAEKTHSYKKETALTQPRVVIVGGGFGGLCAARGLVGAPVSVTLTDKRKYHLFKLTEKNERNPRSGSPEKRFSFRTVYVRL